MTKSIMAAGNRDIKQRRTFTLFPASLAYLEHETRQRMADSQSAVLDELLQEKKREQQMVALETAIGAYYDCLTDEEVEEQRSWGEFAGQTLVLTEEELAHDQSAARRNLVHKASDRPSRKGKASSRDRLSQRTK
jgi:hypothetical protein